MIPHKPKILIASSSFTRFPTHAQFRLKSLREEFEVIDNPYGRRMTKEELQSKAIGCQGIIAGLEEYDKTLLKKLSSSLKCISRDGVGMDNVDMEAAKKYGISVCNTVSAATDAVAELTVGLIISLLRKIPQKDFDAHRGKWIQTHGSLLKGKTVGIIGMGNIGKRVCELLGPFGCQILGNDLKPDRNWRRCHFVSKSQLFSNSDIISLHASYLPRNYHLIDSDSFKKMKAGALFLNLSRGPMVNEKALVKALTSSKIAGAALDVFEEEPYNGPLVKISNVILTPHIGASTWESRYLMQLGAINNLIKALNEATGI